MPTYQYVCTECATPLEAVQKFTDDALTQCPTCGGKLRKLFSSVGIVFKGSGFYKTDSRGAASSSITSESSDSGKSTAAPAKTEKAESTKSETKSAASSDTSTSSTKSASTDSTS